MGKGKSKITLEVESYQIDDIIPTIIKHLLRSKECSTNHELAVKLGVSDRTIYRWLALYNIKYKVITTKTIVFK